MPNLWDALWVGLQLFGEMLVPGRLKGYDSISTFGVVLFRLGLVAVAIMGGTAGLYVQGILQPTSPVERVSIVLGAILIGILLSSVLQAGLLLLGGWLFTAPRWGNRALEWILACANLVGIVVALNITIYFYTAQRGALPVSVAPIPRFAPAGFNLLPFVKLCASVLAAVLNAVPAAITSVVVGIIGKEIWTRLKRHR